MRMQETKKKKNKLEIRLSMTFYTPLLVESEYYLLRSLKKALMGKAFPDERHIKLLVKEFFVSNPIEV